jgi:hypothetical protein
MHLASAPRPIMISRTLGNPFDLDAMCWIGGYPGLTLAMIDYTAESLHQLPALATAANQ